MSVRGYIVGLAVTHGIEQGSLNASMLREALRSQVYETVDGRALRALRPLVPAERVCRRDADEAGRSQP